MDELNTTKEAGNNYWRLLDRIADASTIAVILEAQGNIPDGEYKERLSYEAGWLFSALANMGVTPIEYEALLKTELPCKLVIDIPASPREATLDWRVPGIHTRKEK